MKGPENNNVEDSYGTYIQFKNVVMWWENSINAVLNTHEYFLSNKISLYPEFIIDVII